MPALKPTDFTAKIVWLGRVTEATKDIRSAPVEAIPLDWDGVPGDTHSGVNRPSCSRLLSQYARGTEIRNVRQLSIVSAEELSDIAARIGLTDLPPEWLGATMVIEGLPDFSHVPPSSRLQLDDGGMLVIDMENRPCHLPAREIAKTEAEAAKRFKAAAKGKRGVTAWVERPGVLRLGGTLRLQVPDQPLWAHHEALRGS